MTPSLAMQQAAIALRPVAPEDETFLFQVYVSTRAEELGGVGWTPQQQQRFLQMQFLAQRKHYSENYPGAEFQVIEIQGQPAGRLYLHQREQEIRIMDIALLPAHRRQGVGTILMNEILSDAAKARKTVSIHVEIFNPALRWYEELGFRQISSYGPYQLMEWSPVTEVARSASATPAESQAR